MHDGADIPFVRCYKKLNFELDFGEVLLHHGAVRQYHTLLRNAFTMSNVGILIKCTCYWTSGNYGTSATWNMDFRRRHCQGRKAGITSRYSIQFLSQGDTVYLTISENLVGWVWMLSCTHISDASNFRQFSRRCDTPYTWQWDFLVHESGWD